MCNTTLCCEIYESIEGKSVDDKVLYKPCLIAKTAAGAITLKKYYRLYSNHKLYNWTVL